MFIILNVWLSKSACEITRHEHVVVVPSRPHTRILSAFLERFSWKYAEGPEKVLGPGTEWDWGTERSTVVKPLCYQSHSHSVWVRICERFGYHLRLARVRSGKTVLCIDDHCWERNPAILGCEKWLWRRHVRPTNPFFSLHFVPADMLLVIIRWFGCDAMRGLLALNDLRLLFVIKKKEKITDFLSQYLCHGVHSSHFAS